MEKDGLTGRTEPASKKQPEERVLGERMGEERSWPGEEVEVSSAKAGRAPGRHYLLYLLQLLSRMLLDALT